MDVRTETLGGLTCQIVDALPEATSPKLIVMLCHGYGAPGTDLVPFGPELLEHSPSLAERVQFLFPEAPLSLEELGMPDGRAWWHLDMRRLQMAAITGQIRDLCADRPEGLVASREKLLQLISQWSKQVGVPLSRFVLGGFSQGSMLATDVTLHLDENPAGLIVMSGSLLNEAEWRELAPRRKGLRVLQSHGHDDPIVPFGGADALRDLWQEVGATVDFVPFRGGHGIPLEVFNRVATTLEGLVATTD